MLNDWTLKTWNRQFGMLFGYDASTNLPNFRLTWAPSQLEKRFGTFADFTPEGIFLREVTEVREVRKYPMLGDCYCIEKLVPAQLMGDEIKTDAKLAYESFFDFRDKKKQPIDPSFEAVKYVIKLAVEGPQSTAEYYMAAAHQEYLKEVDHFMNVLEQE